MSLRAKTLTGLAALAATLVFGVSSVAEAAVSCTIETASDMAFGAYNPVSPAPLDSTGFVSFSCEEVTASDVVMIQMSRGRLGTFIPRYMSGPSPRFEYNLFLDPARTVVWGDGTAGTSQYRGRPLAGGRPLSVPVYGRIAPRQGVRPGPYQDLIVVTLLF